MEVRPCSGALGAEIHGVDLARGIGDEELGVVRRAYATYGVIFFRDQELTPEQHLDFARLWGRIYVTRMFRPVDGHPLIAEIAKRPDRPFNIGGRWHTDHSYDVAPSMGTMLYARELPRSGGDTLFSSMYRAYETLSDGLKRALAGLRAVHTIRRPWSDPSGRPDPDMQDELAARIWNAEGATQDVSHPIVIRHPESGRNALYVNPIYTVRIKGWTREESLPLLLFLYDHAKRPEFTIRFQWQPGSLALWDNRATWHYALNDYPGERRVMHRVSIEGVPLEPGSLDLSR